MSLLSEAKRFVANNIEPQFHQRRLESLNSLRLDDILKRKNPYLFKAKDLINAEDLVKSLVDAHLSSQEETVFGAFFEQLAIFCSAHSVGGRKSGIAGIDLEFEREGVLHLVTIKSGPNWHNASQLAKLRVDFQKARRTLNTSGARREVRCINGCCYGRINKDYGDCEKICGEAFWTLTSGEPNLFVDIVEPLGFQAKRHNDSFERQYGQVRTKFTAQFIEKYCDENFAIDWDRVVRFNSGVPAAKKAVKTAVKKTLSKKSQ